MPRILGVDLPANKRVDIALTYLYGIGRTRAKVICQRTQIDPALRANQLTESHVAAITQVLQDSYTVEGDLRRQVAQNIRRLIAIGCYRGSRHRRGLPVRGQRTSTNARTRKGPRKTVGAIRDKTARKLAKGDGKEE
ncbi:MAG: 30S ribosomal protein S13 [Lentisphaerae bacterium RIFOXYB12_FULL_65_16]|nr:MAG: 30S ribosomal protein S13 [Lentisphaerae bacterium RIFOXYA12_64_32]OGV93305.1 MAG: 30S ribosomal protein S13 [Lentisphaerae bacterium RIFOXYB12_FULL_65_16]